MPVEITNELSPEMQLVADCREAVRKAEAEVERLKGDLKTAKSLWESAVEELNSAIDSAIDAQRQPTLFSRFGGDDPSDPPAAPTPTPPPAPPGEGEPGRKRVTVEASALPGLEPARGLPALPAAKPAGWRHLVCAEELDGPAALFDALAAHGVETLGDLADALVRGDRLGLSDTDLREMKEGIRDVSAADAEPITFPELGEDGEEPEEPAAKPAAKGKKARPQKAT